MMNATYTRERRINDTTSRPPMGNARLFREGPGKEVRLCFMCHALMKNRNGSLPTVTTRGFAPCRAAGRARLDRATVPIARADKRYDTSDFVMELRERTVTPHIAQNQNGRRSAIDGRTTRHPG